LAIPSRKVTAGASTWLDGGRIAKKTDGKAKEKRKNEGG